MIEQMLQTSLDGADRTIKAKARPALMGCALPRLIPLKIVPYDDHTGELARQESPDRPKQGAGGESIVNSTLRETNRSLVGVLTMLPDGHMRCIAAAGTTHSLGCLAKQPPVYCMHECYHKRLLLLHEALQKSPLSTYSCSGWTATLRLNR